MVIRHSLHGVQTIATALHDAPWAAASISKGKNYAIIVELNLVTWTTLDAHVHNIPLTQNCRIRLEMLLYE